MLFLLFYFYNLLVVTFRLEVHMHMAAAAEVGVYVDSCILGAVCLVHHQDPPPPLACGLVTVTGQT